DRWNRVVTLSWNQDQLVSVMDDAGRGLSFLYSRPPGTNSCQANRDGALGAVLLNVSDAYGHVHNFETADQLGEPWDPTTFKKLSRVTVAGPAGTFQAWRFTWSLDFLVGKTEPDGIGRPWPGNAEIAYAWEAVTYRGTTGARPSAADYDGRMLSATAHD